jgi:hypothetical protein
MNRCTLLLLFLVIMASCSKEDLEVEDRPMCSAGHISIIVTLVDSNGINLIENGAIKNNQLIFKERVLRKVIASDY